MNGGMPRKGFLRSHSLPKILIHLNRQRATGVLSVTAHGITKKVYLDKGNAVFGSSDYEDDRLGEALLKAGKISERQYEEAVEAMRGSGRRMGSVLVEFGHLSPRDLFEGVKYQVREIILSLFRLKDGMYGFEEGAIPAESITLDLSMASIIYEGVRRIDDWTRIKSEMTGPEAVFIVSTDPRSLFQAVDLRGDDKRILSLLDGERTMRQVMEESGLGSFEAMKSLYTLWSIGLITDQFDQDAVGLTLEDILKPVDDRREEFIARVESIHSALGSLSHRQLLAVDEYADIENINRQYYKLAKEFHPDRYGSSLDPAVRHKAADIFDAITYAYESLKSSETSRQFTEGDEALAAELLRSALEEIKGGNFRRAGEFLEEGVKANPDSHECWNYLSLALSKQPGRFPEAEEAMRKALKLDPDHTDYHANLGLLLLISGRTEEAMKEFERSLSLDPSNRKAQKGLSRILGG